MRTQPTIKVLHIIKSLGRGGAEMLLPESIKLHNKAGFEFHVIYFLPWKDQMVESLVQSGAHVNCMRASNNILILLKAKSIIRYVKQHNIQLIHAHLPWAGFASRLVNKIARVPVLYTEHNKQERYHFLTRWLNRLTFRWQTAAIAVSADVADSISKNLHSKTPVITVLNGVNTDSFARDSSEGLKIRNQFKIPADALIVGTVAVFRFQKRLIEWLEVFKEASGRNPKLYGIIVGDGPLRAEIEERRKALGLDEKVLMPGLQTDVKPWYSAMDIFMMTSIFEGLPIALLEAMSMNCAIATTTAGGIKEVVQDGMSGRVVAVENWKELSTILGELSNEKTRTSLALAARKRVEESFSLKRMVDELEQLYRKFAK